MPGLIEEFLDAGDFDDPAGVHDGDDVGVLGDDAEVVGDQEDRHAALALKFSQEFEDLGLDGDVQRRGRLIGDQEPGLAGEGHGDHDALAHAT